MLSVESARKIGINACIDKIGRDFVMAHKDSSTSAYGECEDGVFCFVGVDDNPVRSQRDDTLVLDSQTSFPYRASCSVNLQNGTAKFIECVSPA